MSAPFSAGLTWPVILEKAMEDARAYAAGGSLDDVLLNTEGDMRLAYDRGQQDERAAIAAWLRTGASLYQALADNESGPSARGVTAMAGAEVLRRRADSIEAGEHQTGA